MPIVTIAFAGSLSLLFAYALFRWHENIARGMARGTYCWQQLLLPPALRVRRGASLWPIRILIFLFAAGPAVVGLLLWGTVIGFLIEAVRGNLPENIWDTPAKTAQTAHSSVDVIFLTVFGVLLLPIGIHYIVARGWFARQLHWSWDVDLPIDAPYPKKRDPTAPSCHPRYVTSAAVMGVIMLLGGIACLVAAVRILL